jgi:hypothetical protein
MSPSHVSGSGIDRRVGHVRHHVEIRHVARGELVVGFDAETRRGRHRGLDGAQIVA